jgi:single-strand DNA-binding protein
MADDINRVNMTGRLTKDSELKYTTSGKPVLGFSIAVNRSVRRNNNYESVAWYFDVTVWGKRGEALANYLKKGVQVAIEGHMRQDQWEQDGFTRSRVLIEMYDMDRVMFYGGKPRGEPAQPKQNKTGNGSGNRQQPHGNRDSYKGYTPPPEPVVGNDYEDDIPF